MQPHQPPLSLYIHLPWCVSKCPYCDFNSHTAGDKTPRARYVAAILQDLHCELSRADGRELGSIFLGGGTPSLFSPSEIAAILQQVRDLFTLASDCEITMEANPGTIEHGNLSGYRRAGVNRLSIGAQSFDGQMLKVLGRIHGPAEIRKAWDEALLAEFDSINIDLMFALPGQDLAMATQDVKKVLELSPQHISYYQLTLEPNTVFHHKPPQNIPDDEASWEIQTTCHALLKDAGYGQYEISAFAKEGKQCRHNLNYWTFGDYLAVGAGAHGKYTDGAGHIWRYQKPANPLMYMQNIENPACQTEPEQLAPADIGFEFMLNALRLSNGFSEAVLFRRTGLTPSDLKEPIESALADGLIERTADGIWQPTAAGFQFLNELQARFLP